MRNLDLEKQQIAEAMDAFPGCFGLRAFRNAVFRVADFNAHFVLDGDVQLVVDIAQPDGTWLNFGRNTPDHIRREMVTLTVCQHASYVNICRTCTKKGDR